MDIYVRQCTISCPVQEQTAFRCSIFAMFSKARSDGGWFHEPWVEACCKSAKRIIAGKKNHAVRVKVRIRDCQGMEGLSRRVARAWTRSIVGDGLVGGM